MHQYKGYVSHNGQYCYDLDFRNKTKVMAKAYAQELESALQKVDPKYKVSLLEWTIQEGTEIQL